MICIQQMSILTVALLLLSGNFVCSFQLPHTHVLINRHTHALQGPIPLFSSNEEDSGSVEPDVQLPDTTSTSSASATNDENEPPLRVRTPRAPGPDAWPATHSSAPGNWEESHGNYVLRPPVSSPPRALVHFLGGAFVGAAPDITYRYVLERLSAQGYLVVATPYRLSFDYLTTCDSVLNKFEKIAPGLARQYGAVPVVGVGHSCGALLHLLITSLFPDTPRAANALISYNNKSVNDAVPLFEELFSPLFQAVAGGGEEGDDKKTGIDSLQMALDMARMTAEGELPSDKLLQEFYTALLPSPLQQQGSASSTIISTLVTIPPPIRDALNNLLSQTKSVTAETGDLLPLVQQSLDVFDQIPSLIREVAVDGVTDFTPSRASIRQAARRAYRARRTLLLQYKDDGIDESPEVESLLKEAETVMRMKRPMVNNMDLKRVVLEGNHATPVLAPPLDTAERLEDVLGEDRAKESLLYKQADETVKALVSWLEEGQL